MPPARAGVRLGEFARRQRIVAMAGAAMRVQAVHHPLGLDLELGACLLGLEPDAELELVALLAQFLAEQFLAALELEKGPVPVARADQRRRLGLAIDPDACRRQVQPHRRRHLGLETGRVAVPQRHRRGDAVGELHEGAARLQHIEGLFEQRQATTLGLVAKRQARHDRRDRLVERVAERLGQAVGVALDDGRPRVAAGEQPAELRIEFDEDQPLGRDAARDQRLRHGTGPWPEFDDRACAAGVHVAGHGPGQESARRRYGTRVERIFEPGADEPGLVGEPHIERRLAVGRGSVPEISAQRHPRPSIAPARPAAPRSADPAPMLLLGHRTFIIKVRDEVWAAVAADRLCSPAENAVATTDEPPTRAAAGRGSAFHPAIGMSPRNEFRDAHASIAAG